MLPIQAELVGTSPSLSTTSSFACASFPRRLYPRIWQRERERERERGERERERERDRQTDRQREKETQRHRDTDTERERDREHRRNGAAERGNNGSIISA